MRRLRALAVDSSERPSSGLGDSVPANDATSARLRILSSGFNENVSVESFFPGREGGSAASCTAVGTCTQSGAAGGPSGPGSLGGMYSSFAGGMKPAARTRWMARSLMSTALSDSESPRSWPQAWTCSGPQPEAGFLQRPRKWRAQTLVWGPGGVVAAAAVVEARRGRCAWMRAASEPTTVWYVASVGPPTSAGYMRKRWRVVSAAA
ncbi:hypothetical protein GSI_00195 [Ganoderma sinense ZZ0214-1]|uniref:Uncharacterized protein n=1 Tax=Ganoderma sinense ZZ0214-1 TaxID=1077348 RepID=A0A2G8SRV9_9APHY|nr:hypothetical protein GSI_00195 [Ganoderma sinense ZZ0214-1]